MGKFLNFFLDLIFPKFCVGCQKEGDWLCEACQKKILLVKTQVCPECGRISQFGKYCSRDRRPHGLSGIIVSCYYNEGPIKETIHNLKYNHILELGDILSEILVQGLKDNRAIGNKLLVTAVPLHFLRRAQRGYNQSEILAVKVADKLLAKSQAIKLEKNFQILVKIRRTKPQVKFSGKIRRKNLEKSFKFCGNLSDIKGRIILIVDDVTTTGTTLNECAKVLRAAGARKVWGLVVAKG